MTPLERVDGAVVLRAARTPKQSAWPGSAPATRKYTHQARRAKRANAASRLCYGDEAVSRPAALVTRSDPIRLEGWRLTRSAHLAPRTFAPHGRYCDKKSCNWLLW